MNKILLMFFLPIVTASLQDDQITCSIARVDSGQDIALTCLFPEDLNVTKKDYSVYHYTKDTKPDAVIDCWWMKGNLSCNVNDGYKYNKTVNTQLTVTLSNVSTTHMGTYACQVAGYRSSSFGTCQLETEQVNQEGKISCTIPLVQPDEDASLTCHYPEDLSVTKKDFSVYYYTEGKNPEAVLDCWWMETLKCLANPGYTYNMKVNTQLTLSISHVTSVNTGTYACQVAGYRPSSFGTCRFEIEKSYREKEIWCFMPHVQLGEEATFTCGFPEDLSVTKKNFSVYHYTEFADAVVDCWWINGELKCLSNLGYTYTNKDGTTLTVTVNHVTESHAGAYVCQIAGYRQNSFGICPVKIYVTEKPDSHQIQTNTGSETFWILYEFVILPVSFTVLLIYFIFWLKKKCQGRLGRRLKRKLRFRKRIPAEYEEALVFFDETGDQTNIHDEVTEQFKQYLQDEVKKMYPKYLESFYFVPPVHFNKGRYQNQCLAGHEVYVPDPTDPSDVRHDQAMQRVLHCLLRMAEQHEEQMFVLTQFKYEDYLNSPIHRYKRNHLPMPFALQEEDKSVGCFDILIVHRYQGVQVLVVKDVDPQDGEQDKVVSAKLTEGLKQLKLANRMVKYLIQDLPNIPKIQQAMILPNCNSESLSQVLDRSTNLEKEIRECFELNDSDDPTELFLCAEHLSEPEKPWDVPHDVVKSVGNWWNKLMDAAQTDEAMTDNIYLTMITRFFGPATQSTLEDTDGSEQLVLPKTLAEAVSLTGDLYRRQVLYPDMIDLLQEPKVFLAGPQSTEKTTMLNIACTKWLTSGKHVFIVKGVFFSKSCSFLLHIEKSLQKELATQSTSGRSHGHVFHIDCDFSSEEGIDNCIEEIISTTEDTKDLCVLIETHPEGKREKLFCEQLLKKSQDICLWIVGHDTDDCPAIGEIRSYTLTTALSCPPAVVREVAQNFNLKYSQEYEFPPPTDGPPVKHVYHRVEDHHQKSHCCWKCGNKVGRFLSDIFSEKEFVPQGPKHPVKRNLKKETAMRGSSLRYKDILILFECSFKDNDNFLIALRHSNIPVQTLSNENIKNVSTDDDTACAISVTDMQVYRPKKKIVVYVEMDEQLYCSEYKERALTSCTSQLIWVHCK